MPATTIYNIHYNICPLLLYLCRAECVQLRESLAESAEAKVALEQVNTCISFDITASSHFITVLISCRVLLRRWLH